MRRTYWVYLKNGAVLKVRAKNATVTHNTGTGHIMSWQFDGLAPRYQRPLFIDTSEIVAVMM